MCREYGNMPAIRLMNIHSSGLEKHASMAIARRNEWQTRTELTRIHRYGENQQHGFDALFQILLIEEPVKAGMLRETARAPRCRGRDPPDTRRNDEA
jgi:hypothetical protein